MTRGRADEEMSGDVSCWTRRALDPVVEQRLSSVRKLCSGNARLTFVHARCSSWTASGPPESTVGWLVSGTVRHEHTYLPPYTASHYIHSLHHQRQSPASISLRASSGSSESPPPCNPMILTHRSHCTLGTRESALTGWPFLRPQPRRPFVDLGASRGQPCQSDTTAGPRSTTPLCETGYGFADVRPLTLPPWSTCTLNSTQTPWPSMCTITSPLAGIISAGGLAGKKREQNESSDKRMRRRSACPGRRGPLTGPF
nr:hypothetical protein CFP56_03750 [Quercus suber]